MGYILIPVYSDEEKVDLLTGLVANQKYGYYAGSDFRKSRPGKFGEAVSEFTGEVFKVRGDRNQENIRTGTYHINLIGSRGSHYVGTFTYDSSGELIYLRISVPDPSNRYS